MSGDTESECAGELVLFLQTALTADELVPAARELGSGGRFHPIVQRRRGYDGTVVAPGTETIRQLAADAVALLDQLEIDQAHVVGLSFSAATALQLAADHESRIRSLTLIEPPPIHTPGAAAFIAVSSELIALRRQLGPKAALEQVMAMLSGPSWRDESEELLPGSVAQMERDAATFFDADLPALLNWKFGADDAARIGVPTLCITGGASGPMFAEVPALMHKWFPRAEHKVIAQASHSVALTHSIATARLLREFLMSLR